MMVPLPSAQHFALQWIDRLKWRTGDGKGLLSFPKVHTIFHWIKNQEWEIRKDDIILNASDSVFFFLKNLVCLADNEGGGGHTGPTWSLPQRIHCWPIPTIRPPLDMDSKSVCSNTCEEGLLLFCSFLSLVRPRGTENCLHSSWWGAWNITSSQFLAVCFSVFQW